MIYFMHRLKFIVALKVNYLLKFHLIFLCWLSSLKCISAFSGYTTECNRLESLIEAENLIGYWSSSVNQCLFLQVETILLNNSVETDGYL